MWSEKTGVAGCGDEHYSDQEQDLLRGLTDIVRDYNPNATDLVYDVPDGKVTTRTRLLYHSIHRHQLGEFSFPCSVDEGCSEEVFRCIIHAVKYDVSSRFRGKPLRAIA